MRSDYDVIVVGAGPGGTTACRYCARAGLKTLLIDKDQFPRYKVCGGCLSLKTVRLLNLDLGPVVENTVSAVKFTYRARDPLLIDSEDPIGLMVMRDRFDAFLVREAVKEGSEFLDGDRVLEARELGNGTEVVLTSGKRLSCQYLMGADGAESVIAKSFPFSLRKIRGDEVGLQSEVPYSSAIFFKKEDLRRVHLDFGRIPKGYGWVFPKKEGLSIGVGGVFRGGEKNIHQYFRDFVQDLKLIPGRKVEKTLGHRLPVYDGAGQKVSYKNVLLVGDAGGMIDPLTGEGIYYAIRSGMLAAEAVLRSKKKGNLAGALYQTSVQEQIFLHLQWALHVSRIIYRFPRLSYRTLRQYPELGGLCMQMLGGQATYPAFVVKVRERIKDLLKGKIGEKIRKAMANP
jgi:geranylgeranyl reductase family protein